VLLCWQRDGEVTAVLFASGYVMKLANISAVLVISVGSQNSGSALHAPH
jgi:hypothetical protein